MGRQLVLDAIRNGASDFVVKPIQKDRLSEAIGKLIGASEAAKQEITN